MDPHVMHEHYSQANEWYLMTEITRLVKKETGKTTLRIGDGVNDVGMILALA